MAKLTLEELRKLRSEAKKNLDERLNAKEKVTILVGVGTCGLAAGAQKAIDAFNSEIREHGAKNIEIKETGCMGLCYSEPTVEIVMPGMPTIIYGMVDDEVARKIFRKHILGKTLINDYIYDRPAADILSNGGAK
jgi:NADP-reducing hydrogenase subunit HndB